MVFGANDVIDAQGVLLNHSPTPVKDVTLEELAMRVTPCPSQCLYRRVAVLKINGYNEAFRYIVVSPGRNEPEYMRRTLDSMVAQTLRQGVVAHRG